jgi:putative cofactor-binding repeat protein
MSAVGPNSAPQTSPPELVLTRQGALVTVGAADVPLAGVFNCGFARRVVAQAAGTVFVQRADDSAPIGYLLAAGAAVTGNIILIGGTNNYPTASAIKINLEV